MRGGQNGLMALSGDRSRRKGQPPDSTPRGASSHTRETPTAAGSHPYELAPEDPPVAERACPSCGRKMYADALQCASCGFHARRGLGVSAEGAPHAAIPCRGCGYDLAGNTSGVCPECGTRVARSKRDLLADQHEVTRTAYLRPAIAGVIGAALLPVLMHGPAWMESWVYAAGIAAVAGAVVHVIFSGLAFGRGESIALNAAQGAGLAVFLLAPAAWLLPIAGVTGFSLFQLVLALAVAAGAGMTVLEESDAQDAAIAVTPLAITAIGALELAQWLA